MMERKWIIFFIGLLFMSLFITTQVLAEDSVQKTILELPLTEEDGCETTIPFPEDRLITFTPRNGNESYFNFSINQSYEHIENGYYAGWCVESAEHMTRNINHTGEAYSSYDFDNMPEFFCYGHERNSEQHKMIWKKINYLLNNIKNTSHPIYDACPLDKKELRDDIQDVIWNLTNGKPSEPFSDCAKHILDHLNNASNNISTYCPQDYIVVLINTYEEPDPDPEPEPDPDPKPKPKDDGRSGTNQGNTPPTADASKNEPFTAVIGEPITFDGSRSYDYDGHLIEWNWSLGDGTYHLGEIITHTYSTHGTFHIYLNVTDNDGSTDSYHTTAVIVQPNRPPNTPTLIGNTTCTTQTPYIYKVISIDLDNDSISYTIDWGDETNSITTDFFANNTPATLNHIWSKPGIYIIKLFANDSLTLSDTTETIIYADVQIYYINDITQGYLIDYGKDGYYEAFHSNTTGKETTIEQEEDGWYNIDENNDGIMDYQYHTTQGIQTYQAANENIKQEEPISTSIIFTIIALILCIISVVFIYTRIK